MPISVDILINDQSWLKQNADIENLVSNKVIEIVKLAKLNDLKDCEIEVSIVLTDDKEIQDLNKDYRKKDKPTNVLSFPAQDFKDINNNVATDNFLAIGDIILSHQTIKKESEEQNKSFEDHLIHLVVHSVLHLVGYDHESDKDAKIMESFEIEILKKLEIDNPYIIN